MQDCKTDVPADHRLEFRVGINLGDIMDGDDIYGDGVNVAARLEGLAEASGVRVTKVVRREDIPQWEVSNV